MLVPVGSPLLLSGSLGLTAPVAQWFISAGAYLSWRAIVREVQLRHLLFRFPFPFGSSRRLSVAGTSPDWIPPCRALRFFVRNPGLPGSPGVAFLSSTADFSRWRPREPCSSTTLTFPADGACRFFHGCCSFTSPPFNHRTAGQGSLTFGIDFAPLLYFLSPVLRFCLLGLTLPPLPDHGNVRLIFFFSSSESFAPFLSYFILLPSPLPFFFLPGASTGCSRPRWLRPSPVFPDVLPSFSRPFPLSPPFCAALRALRYLHHAFPLRHAAFSPFSARRL